MRDAGLTAMADHKDLRTTVAVNLALCSESWFPRSRKIAGAVDASAPVQGAAEVVAGDSPAPRPETAVPLEPSRDR
jgi:hypothetical protein